MNRGLFCLLTVASLFMPACHYTGDKPHMIVLCTSTVNAYAHARDELDKETFSALFSENAKNEIAGNRTIGRHAITNEMLLRGEGKNTLHIMGSINVTPLSNNRAIGSSYADVFSINTDTVPPASKHLALVKYVDEYELINEKCLIKSRKMEILAESQD